MLQHTISSHWSLKARGWERKDEDGAGGELEITVVDEVDGVDEDVVVAVEVEEEIEEEGVVVEDVVRVLEVVVTRRDLCGTSAYEGISIENPCVITSLIWLRINRVSINEANRGNRVRAACFFSPGGLLLRPLRLRPRRQARRSRCSWSRRRPLQWSLKSRSWRRKRTRTAPPRNS